MSREFQIGFIFALLLHAAVGMWGYNHGDGKPELPPHKEKIVRTVKQNVELPKPDEPPKVIPPKLPELVVKQANPTEKPAEQPKAVAPKSRQPKPENAIKNEPPPTNEPAPLVLSKTYGGDGGVEVNAGKDDSLGDPNVAPTETNTRKRMETQQTAPSAGDDDGDESQTSGAKDERPIEIVHAVTKKCTVAWPDGAEAGNRIVEIKLTLWVGTSGNVTKVKLLRGNGEPFDSAALAAGKLCTFTPGTRDGKPFADRVPFTMEFKPNGR